MNPSNQPGGTQADPTQQPQAGATPNTTPPATLADAANSAQQHAQATPPANAAPQAGTDEPMSLEEAKKLRAESASLRKRLKEFDDAAAAAELAKLGDLERAKKQAETATAQATAYRQQLASMTVQLEAAKLGFIDPADAAVLLASKLEIDEATGQPTNAEKLLSDLLKAKPYLAKATEAQQTAAGQQQAGQQPGTPGAPHLSATNPGRGTGGQQAQQAKDPTQLARFGQGRDLFKK